MMTATTVVVGKRRGKAAMMLLVALLPAPASSTLFVYPTPSTNDDGGDNGDGSGSNVVAYDSEPAMFGRPFVPDLMEDGNLFLPPDEGYFDPYLCGSYGRRTETTDDGEGGGPSTGEEGRTTTEEDEDEERDAYLLSLDDVLDGIGSRGLGAASSSSSSSSSPLLPRVKGQLRRRRLLDDQQRYRRQEQQRKAQLPIQDTHTRRSLIERMGLSVSTPNDNDNNEDPELNNRSARPIALLVRRGRCTFEQKALNAMKWNRKLLREAAALGVADYQAAQQQQQQQQQEEEDENNNGTETSGGGGTQGGGVGNARPSDLLGPGSSSSNSGYGYGSGSNSGSGGLEIPSLRIEYLVIYNDEHGGDELVLMEGPRRDDGGYSSSNTPDIDVGLVFVGHWTGLELIDRMEEIAATMEEAQDKEEVPKEGEEEARERKRADGADDAAEGADANGNANNATETSSIEDLFAGDGDADDNNDEDEANVKPPPPYHLTPRDLFASTVERRGGWYLPISVDARSAHSTYNDGGYWVYGSNGGRRRPPRDSYYWIRFALIGLLVLTPIARGFFVWYSAGGRIRTRRNEAGWVVGLRVVRPTMRVRMAWNDWGLNGDDAAEEEGGGRVQKLTEEQVLALPEIVYVRPEEEEEEEEEEDGEEEDGGGDDIDEAATAAAEARAAAQEGDRFDQEEEGDVNFNKKDSDGHCASAEDGREASPSAARADATTTAGASTGDLVTIINVDEGQSPPTTIGGDDDERTEEAIGDATTAASAAAAAATTTTCTSCSICIDEYEEGEKLRLLPRCGHAFHTDCILPWLTERSGSCPLCKRNVIGEGTDGVRAAVVVVVGEGGDGDADGIEEEDDGGRDEEAGRGGGGEGEGGSSAQVGPASGGDSGGGRRRRRRRRRGGEGGDD